MVLVFKTREYNHGARDIRQETTQEELLHVADYLSIRDEQRSRPVNAATLLLFLDGVARLGQTSTS